MKRTIWLFIFLVTTVIAPAQYVIQKGIAFRYNGRKPRTPLGNVYIKTSNSSNGVLSDSINGLFTLYLKDKQMGSPIGRVNIAKKGMMIFNQQAVDEWSVRKEPLCLILCDADEFEKQKQNLITIGQQEAKKRYDKKIAEIELIYQKESAEWYQKLSEADEEIQNIRKHIGEYADLFARIDESEIDTLAQQAIDLFNNGYIEEAIRKFEEGRYLEKLRTVRRAQKQGNAIISNIQKEVKKAQLDELEYISSLNAQIKAYRLHGDWQKVQELMKGLADELNSFKDNYSYATFCSDQKLYEESDRYFQRTYEILRQESCQDEEGLYKPSYLLSKAMLLYNWGALKCKKLEYEKSEEFLLSALEIYRNLANNDFITYGLSVANTLNELSWVESYANKPKDRDTYLLDAWNICKHFEDLAPQRYDAIAPIIIYNMAAYYWRNQQYEESERMWMKALVLYQKENNLPYIAGVYNNMGKLYSDMKKNDKSQLMFTRALEIREKLASYNFYEFGADYSATLDRLGLFYESINAPEEAKKYHRKNLEVRRQLLNTDPTINTTDVAWTLCYLARLYLRTEQLDSCEIFCRQVIEITDKQFDNTKQSYNGVYAGILIDLADLLNERGIYNSAHWAYSVALPIYRDNANMYALTLNNLSFNLIFMKDYSKAEELAIEGLSTDSTKHWIATNLAAALLFQGKFEEAEKIYRQYKVELREPFLDDFMQFEKAGVIPKKYEADVEKIKKILNE